MGGAGGKDVGPGLRLFLAGVVRTAQRQRTVGNAAVLATGGPRPGPL